MRVILVLLAILAAGCGSEKAQVQAYLDATGKLARQIQPLLERWVTAGDLMPGRRDEYLRELATFSKEANRLKTELQAVPKPPPRAQALNDAYIQLLDAFLAALQEDEQTARLNQQTFTRAELEASLAASEQRVNSIVKAQHECSKLRKEVVALSQ